MNREGLKRTTKILVMIVVAATILYVVRIVLPTDPATYAAERVDAVVAELAGSGTVGVARSTGNGVTVYPIESEFGTAAAVAVVDVVGYRSTITTAYRIAPGDDDVAVVVVSNGETPPLNRRLVEAGLDATTGATITRRAIERGAATARNAVERALSETQ